MNREIKFRIYNHDKKEFIIHEEIPCSFYSDTLFDLMKKGTVLDDIDSCQLTITQYTGLKDRNGKEIYEGDIVKYDTTSIEGSVGQGVVEWCDDFMIGSYPGWMLWCPRWAYHMELLGCEVIGNIYENPELLNE